MSSQQGADSPTPQTDRAWNVRRFVGRLTILYWIALFISTHVPLPELPGAGAGSDKVAHVVAFTGLGMLTGLWLALGRKTSLVSFLLLLCVLLVYGAVDEWLQQFVNRETDIKDWIADGTGATIGVGAIVLLQTVSPLRRPQSPSGQ